MATFYSPKEYKDWQAGGLVALKQVAAPAAPIEGRVSVELLVGASRPKTTKLPHPKPDVDNYAKAVLDILTTDGRFWRDDSQVQQLTVAKTWADDPFVSVTIKEL